MRVDGVPYRTIRVAEDGTTVEILDQTQLPHAFRVVALRTLDDALRAIRTMQVRGAPLIGVTAAYGLCLALRADPSDAALERACDALLATRPTAVNLRWALAQMRAALAGVAPAARATSAYRVAAALADEDVALCRAIGEHGVELLADVKRRSGRRSRCSRTATRAGSPRSTGGPRSRRSTPRTSAGSPVHVWVDETRPRNQGASLTAWELGQHGVPHTVIADNAGGHLMRAGRVDVCLTGADRVAANGDVCNKIGTYLKALAARDNGVPFYAALPYSTIDWTLGDGGAIPIEERDAAELAVVRGRSCSRRARRGRACCRAGSAVANPAFDVTPARLVSGLVTERGVCEASREGLLSLYPERRSSRSRVATLHLVATPIGNLEDVTLRALRVLREAELVLAEDTRHTRVLLDRHGIAAEPVSLHGHNEAAAQRARARGARARRATSRWSAMRARRSSPIRASGSCAPRSRRVTPCARCRGRRRCSPRWSRRGSRAARSRSSASRRARPASARRCSRRCATAPRRWCCSSPRAGSAATLRELADALGARRACVARELTKLHEELARGTLDALAERFAAGARGEVTIVVEGAPARAAAADSDLVDAAIRARAAAGGSASEIARDVARATGAPRSAVYRRVRAGRARSRDCDAGARAAPRPRRPATGPRSARAAPSRRGSGRGRTRDRRCR